ncbi:H(+)/Cl(-) exchange transporter ClcA [Tepidibacter thalassicus]|uniref:H+/Cl-antiporter ClcA n=1 Tax=Tepidibacter thalassicus DSM 15285 TaxID=1123350 RepID=A0A1M5PHC5_9FIRM|nr:H(+)/Cl(-) exchange transporter ClcA [Tepidibacter thalassicus]SHH01121.1 H+/Cl-antiporter ClcA [Tepidibacter thalassicus DSM 15285]
MKNKHDTYNTLFHWHNFKLNLVVEGMVVGALAGLFVVLYRFLLEKTEVLTSKIYVLQKQNNYLILVWFIVLALLAYIVGIMIKREPMISGSGIPQVEGVLLRRLNMNWFRVIVGKFVGGVLAIGAGLSLGREGPSVQIGAAIGQGFSRIFKRIKIEEKYLITSGASAGLAAAFNAPLAGVVFALEEVHKNFYPLVLLSAMSASLTADFVSKNFFGLKPVFNFKNLYILPLNQYIYLIVLGIILGVLGAFFNKMLIKTQDFYISKKWLPIEFRPMIPFLIAGVLGLFLPQVLGGGHDLISSLVEGKYTINMIFVILVIKFVFTMLSYGSGAPGGIFLPLLVIGALTGNIYGSIIAKYFQIDSHYISNFIILSMAGYFTAIVKAPITGSILITEMTGSFNHLLPLTIVSIISYVVTDILNFEPIYEVLLERMLNKKGNNEFCGDKSKKVLLEIAVCLGTELDGKIVRDIKWPKNALLVAIKRGELEIIPKGNTKILAGDYLIVLVNEYEAPKVKCMLKEMAEKLLIDNVSNH